MSWLEIILAGLLTLVTGLLITLTLVVRSAGQALGPIIGAVASRWGR